MANSGHRYKPEIGTGNVFYNKVNDLFDTSTYRYWNSIKTKAELHYSEFDFSSSFKEVIPDAVSYLHNLAEAEYAKEVRILETFFGTPQVKQLISDSASTNTKSKNLSAAMNAALGLKDMYNRMITSVINVKTAAEGGNDLGRLTPASYYGPYLKTDLPHVLSNFFNTQDPERIAQWVESNGKDPYIDNALTETIRNTMEVAMDKSLGRLTDKNRNNIKVAQEVLAVWKESKEFQSRFLNDLWSQYGMKDFLSSLVNVVDAMDPTNKTADAFRAEMEKNINATKFSSSFSGTIDSQTIAGSVAEYIVYMIRKAMSKKMKNGAMSIALAGKTGRADLISVLSKLSVDYTAEITAYLDTHQGTSIAQSFKTIENFVDLINKKADDTMIIKENIKKYNLGKNFRGFKGGSRNLEGLEATLSAMNFSKAQQMIDYIKQTMPSAVMADQKQEVRDDLSVIVANFLFDDFNIIDKSKGVNVVHVFDLSNIVVPLSYLLFRLADALNQTNKDLKNNPGSFARVDIHYPKPSPQYNVEEDYPMRGRNLSGWGTTAYDSKLRWDNQMEAADDIQISITFFANFKKLIRDENIFSLLD